MAQDYIFIHIPRTGGRSILNALGQEHEMVSPSHMTVSQYIEEKGEEWVRNAFKFTVVRNPWERAVSLWQMHVFKLYRPFHTEDKKIMTFEQWLFSHENHWIYKRQTTDEFHYCRTKSQQLLVDEFIKFENISQEFAPIAQKLGVNPTLKRIGDEDRTSSSEKMVKIISEKLRFEVESGAIKSEDRAQILNSLPTIPTNWKDNYTKQEQIDFVSERNDQLIKMFNYTF